MEGIIGKRWVTWKLMEGIIGDRVSYDNKALKEEII